MAAKKTQSKTKSRSVKSMVPTPDYHIIIESTDAEAYTIRITSLARFRTFVSLSTRVDGTVQPLTILDWYMKPNRIEVTLAPQDTSDRLLLTAYFYLETDDRTVDFEIGTPMTSPRGMIRISSILARHSVEHDLSEGTGTVTLNLR